MYLRVAICLQGIILTQHGLSPRKPPLPVNKTTYNVGLTVFTVCKCTYFLNMCIFTLNVVEVH